jgi:hypothetical protein
MKRLLLSLVVVLTAGLPGLALGQAGSVVLKIHVANPSQKEPQTIPVKVYLPKEATPKDVKDVGDLKLDYDPDPGMYYVHGEVTLEPGQSTTNTVRLDDIWVFTEDQLAAFVGRASALAGLLAATPAAQEAAAIVQRIEAKVKDILKRQNETEGNPGERIQAYRQGLSTITTIEQDLEALEKLKEDAPGPASSKAGERDARLALLAGSEDSPEGEAPLGRSLSMTAAWRIILAILAFLGALSAVFFLTWHRLLRVTVGKEQEAVPLIQGDSTG